MSLPARSATVLLSVALAGCVFGQRGRTSRTSTTAPQAATLEVDNQYAGPVNLYVVRGSTATPTRLGQVSGNRVRRFRVDQTILGGSTNISFIAVPPASQTRASTGSIVVRGGDFVRFVVTQDLRSSTVFVQ